MRARADRLKMCATACILLPALGVIFFSSASRATSATAQTFDAAATYKAKCAMCHGQGAEKNFDPAKADDQLNEAIAKGVKPKMPSYEAKGIDAEQATALVTHMKQLKGAAAKP